MSLSASPQSGASICTSHLRAWAVLVAAYSMDHPFWFKVAQWRLGEQSVMPPGMVGYPFQEGGAWSAWISLADDSRGKVLGEDKSEGESGGG